LHSLLRTPAVGTGSSKDGVIAKIDLKFSEESVSEP
jgi:hypothetical protein